MIENVRSIGPVIMAVFLAAPSLSQPAADGQRFGLADVHVRPPNWLPGMRSRFTGGRYELRNATMVDLIRTAWGLDADKVTGGPEWLETDRFDVVALAAEDSKADARRAMLRALLEERFRLVVHRDGKEMPAWAITATKKLLLRKAAGTEDTGCGFKPEALLRRAASPASRLRSCATTSRCSRSRRFCRSCEAHPNTYSITRWWIAPVLPAHGISPLTGR